mgnify:CR=1 FL=1
MEKKLILDAAAMERAVTRISYEIIEKNKGIEDLALIGIRRRGVSLSKRIAKKIQEIEGKPVERGILDITFYRDDLSLLNEHPVLNGTNIDFQIEGKKIVLVDDVLYTGRTVRAAIMDLGRPKCIQLAIMVDRGHRELPIMADYVGKNLPTSTREVVKVHITEFDGEENIVIEQKK